MRIGGALFLVGVGVILTFAVHVSDPHGFAVNTVGVILMVVGAVGLIVTGTFMTTRRHTDIVDRTSGGSSRRTNVESPVDSRN